MAARYWRVIGVRPFNRGALELSALHLYDGATRVDAAATISSTVAPTTGAVANLQDTDSSTKVRWSSVAASGFSIQWVFSSAVDVDGVRLGSGALADEFAEVLTLEFSTDGSYWVGATELGAFTWPGALSLTPTPTGGDPKFSDVCALLHFDGADGSSSTSDFSPLAQTVTISGSGRISTEQSVFGGASFKADGSYTYAEIAAGNIALGTDWVVEFRVFSDTNAGFGYVSCGQYATIGGLWLGLQFVVRSLGSFVRFYFTATSASNERYVDVAAPAAGTWRAVAMERVGDVGTVYIDGAAVGSVSGLGSPQSNTHPLRVGVFNYDAGVEYGKYWYDDLRITKNSRYRGAYSPRPSAFPDAGGISFPAAVPRAALAATPQRQGDPGAWAPVGSSTTPSQITFRDMEFGGRGRIAGTTKIKGSPDTPVRRRVRLIRDLDELLVREVWSDATTGTYSFDYIAERYTYTVKASDHTGNYRAVLADRVTPEIMA